MADLVGLSPLSAKRLIDNLLEQEVLVMQVTKQTPPGPPAIFGKAKPLVSFRPSNLAV